MKIENLQDLRATDLVLWKLYTFSYKELIFTLEKVYTKSYGCFYILSCKEANFQKKFTSIAELRANISYTATSYHRKKDIDKKKEEEEQIFIGDIGTLQNDSYIIEWDSKKVNRELVERSSLVTNALKKKLENICSSRTIPGRNRLVTKVKKVYEKDSIRYILETPILFTKIEITNILSKLVNKLYYQGRLKLDICLPPSNINTLERDGRYYIEVSWTK